MAITDPHLFLAETLEKVRLAHMQGANISIEIRPGIDSYEFTMKSCVFFDDYRESHVIAT